MLTWMAWTWPTALVFVGIFSAMAVLIILEVKYPGGQERRVSWGCPQHAGTGCLSRCWEAPIYFWLGLGSSARHYGGHF